MNILANKIAFRLWAGFGTIGLLRERFLGDQVRIKAARDAFTLGISRNAQDAAGATGAVAGTIAQVQAVADEAGNGAAMVLQASAGLTERTRLLSRQVGDFLAKVRAA